MDTKIKHLLWYLVALFLLFISSNHQINQMNQKKEKGEVSLYSKMSEVITFKK